MTGKRREIRARLRTQTPHAAMWIEEGTWHDVRQLQRAAETFEADTYTRMRVVFGSEWTPGIDQDPRIIILHATGLGSDVLGYVSSLDEYPRDLYPWSNEAEMITVNVDTIDIGSPSYHTLLARELLRLIQWHQDRNEQRWVREGLAELAATMMGAEADRLHQAYLQQTDTSLTNWIDDEGHRGATHLFMTYFHQQFGDDGTRSLTAEPDNGVGGFESALDKLATEVAFDDLFADWLAANYLDGVSGINEAQYSYADLDLVRPTAAAVYDTYPQKTDASVHQYGADYVVLRGEEDLRVQFTGRTEAPLLTGMPPIGHPMWWSNRADESLTTLTGAFDLRQVEHATLTYRLWYDIEPHYDYVTVEVSRDGGRQWDILHAPSGTDDDPFGNNPGWGYTGKSPDWIQEEIAISDYAGGNLLVRFSYLTDGAITGEGLLLDDISVDDSRHQQAREIEASGWSPDGFVLTDGQVSQDYLVLLISEGEDITIERLPLEEDQSGAWTIPLDSEDLQQAVLVLSAMAPLTHLPAPYQLTISQ